MAMGELIMTLLHARTASHVLHLKTRSYAAHVALSAFYEALVPLIDQLAETYQGVNGIISEYPARYQSYEGPQELLSALLDKIKNCRYSCIDEDDTQMQNIIDEVVALINTTSYKLKFLK